MKNLSQLRAKHAYEAAENSSYKGPNKGDIVKKIPVMIRQNGILGALAFAKENTGGYAGVFRDIIEHLIQLKRIPSSINEREEQSIERFIQHLYEADALELRHITDEAMAYLSFLRRFASKGDGHDRE